MEKKKTPALSVIMYIVGILFLAIGAFMLVMALNYAKLSLEVMSADFSDMWSNLIQYTIAQCGPYFGIGIVSIGIGAMIKEARCGKAMKSEDVADEHVSSAEKGADSINQKKLEDAISYLANNIDTTREVLCIKIEETEKRDAYRLKEMGKGLTAAFETLDRTNQDPINIEVPMAPNASEINMGTAKKLEEQGEAPAGKIPPLFRVADRMAMPSMPRVEACGSRAEKTEVGKTPQLFRVARTMVMPTIPR
ncbi:MAG: hypothetical protein Q4B78_00050 [Bacillota bacterium]|nr:hypothetical protein [Bacillota bacterium]